MPQVEGNSGIIFEMRETLDCCQFRATLPGHWDLFVCNCSGKLEAIVALGKRAEQYINEDLIKRSPRGLNNG